MKHYFLFAGEMSGDLHGSQLIQALRERANTSTFCGVGGPRMRQEGFDCLVPMEEFQVMGLSDVLQSLPHLWKLFYQVRDSILKLQPDCVILIDYPGFNLRLAKALRKQGFQGKIVQYICPTVWAHGKNRIETLAAYYDLLLTILPFEAAYFSQTSLKVEYIGNPLVERIRNHIYRPTEWAQIGLPTDQDLIALFPGSRLGEIQRHIPQQLEVAAQLKSKYPHLRFAISCAQESLNDNLLKLLQQAPRPLLEDLFVVPPQYHYDLMRTCKTALAKSGTVTLELALHGVPTVVHYELSFLNYLFAKYVLRLQLPHYCIVNILSNQRVFPELMGYRLATAHLKEELEILHFTPAKHQRIQMACEQLKQQIGNQSSQDCAARAILELVKC
jgi:lipid-A-disaccharide synthase